MNYIRISSKRYMSLLQDAMIILSEREANRILLSSNKINRNPFVDHETPNFVLQNKSWYDFLVLQVQKRWLIKKKIYEIIPSLFPSCAIYSKSLSSVVTESNDSHAYFQAQLTNLMFTEIKKRRQPTPCLKKEGMPLSPVKSPFALDSDAD